MNEVTFRKRPVKFRGKVMEYTNDIYLDGRPYTLAIGNRMVYRVMRMVAHAHNAKILGVD